MGVFQRSTLSIFYPKGKMSAPKDLVGKRISSCAGDGFAIYLPAFYRAINVKPADVQSVTMGCSVKYTAVAQGRADAVASRRGLHQRFSLSRANTRGHDSPI